MLKLYGYRDLVEDYLIEIPESVFQIDGYNFADRLLEDIMFNVTFKDTKVLNVEVDINSKKRFENFDTQFWLKRAEEHAQWILNLGHDEVLLSDELMKKYDVDGGIFDEETKIITIK